MPEVEALDVHQLVTERQRQFARRKGFERFNRQQDDRTRQAGHLRRPDHGGNAQLGTSRAVVKVETDDEIVEQLRGITFDG